MKNDVVLAEFTAAAQSLESLPPPVQIEVAFAGRSNVGKSSLLNRVMQRKNLARTSSTPGCTRQIVFFNTRLRDGSNLTLVDLPGFGYAQRSKTERLSWAAMIEDYLLQRSSLGVVVILVDARRGLLEEELKLFELLQDRPRGLRPIRTLVVATKLDKVPRAERARALAKISASGHQTIGFSTELPDTAHDVWQRVLSSLASTE